MPQSTDNIFDSLFLMHKGALIEPYSHWHSPIKQIVDIFLVYITQDYFRCYKYALCYPRIQTKIKRFVEIYYFYKYFKTLQNKGFLKNL